MFSVLGARRKKQNMNLLVLDLLYDSIAKTTEVVLQNTIGRILVLQYVLAWLKVRVSEEETTSVGSTTRIRL